MRYGGCLTATFRYGPKERAAMEAAVKGLPGVAKKYRACLCDEPYVDKICRCENWPHRPDGGGSHE